MEINLSVTRLIRTGSCFVFLIILISCSREHGVTLRGEQPRLSIDGYGIIRMVYGNGDSIFYSFSDDDGRSFSMPHLVGVIQGMHLGRARGPQLAGSADYSLITAIDTLGNIHCFVLDHKSREWQETGYINDVRGSAKEGLMDVVADNQNGFYAVWLDCRANSGNQVYFSSSPDHGRSWMPNKLVYRSPDGSVCPCCKPNIAVNDKELAIMFRNWLSGSRDMYVVTSPDRGKKFDVPEKMGFGTWKLNACPMDGGGIAITDKGEIYTTWQRNGEIFYNKAGEAEIKVGPGRLCSLNSANQKTVIAYQHMDTIYTDDLTTSIISKIGNGEFPDVQVLPDHGILIVWEKDGKINYSRI